MKITDKCAAARAISLISSGKFLMRQALKGYTNTDKHRLRYCRTLYGGFNLQAKKKKTKKKDQPEQSANRWIDYLPFIAVAALGCPCFYQLFSTLP